jgi:hypothetical protein
MSPSSFSDFIIPTFADDDKPKQVNVENLRTRDSLAELKKKDPFLYFSIPAVKEAALQFEAPDVSALSGNSARSRTDEGGHDSVVERKKRISFECHPDLYLTTEDFESVRLDGVDEDEEDEFVNFLELYSAAMRGSSLKRKAGSIEKDTEKQ